VNRVLWAYRKHGNALSDFGRMHYAELFARIQAKHPALYSPDAFARIKNRWRPSICVVGRRPLVEPTICDWEVTEPRNREELLSSSLAEVFLFPGDAISSAEELELAALAGLDGKRAARLPHGSVAVPRAVLKRSAALDPILHGPVARRPHLRAPRSAGLFQTLWRHLDNAEMLSADAWRAHPLQVLSRLIPLRWKERINAAAKRRVFDLSFYLRFQPESLVLGDNLVRLVRSIPNLDRSRRRIALVTPHLGPGGAESVLLDAAGALDRSRYQILLIATHSTDGRWADRWRGAVDHIYDLRTAVPARYTAAAIVSIVSNWQCETLLIQNSLAGYEVIADLKTLRPELRIFDLIHAVSEDWNVVTCTAPVADLIDVRVAISQQAHNHLLAAGVRPERIRRIPNGVDLDRYRYHPEPPGCRKILFAGRLDPVKRPKLLVDIARAMADVDGVRFVIAGDGPEEPALRSAAQRAGVLDRFEFLGFVADMAPVFGDASVVIIPSSEEGVPLVLLEAFASGRPVIASDVGAIREILDQETGVLIRRGRREAEEFAGALRELLADPGRRAKMGRSARRKAELMHNRETMLQTYRELFEFSAAEAARSLPVVQ
jgi:glycosyltransferase involved in cell wall biosynthesis